MLLRRKRQDIFRSERWSTCAPRCTVSVSPVSMQRAHSREIPPKFPGNPRAHPGKSVRTSHQITLLLKAPRTGANRLASVQGKLRFDDFAGENVQILHILLQFCAHFCATKIDQKTTHTLHCFQLYSLLLYK